MRWRRKVLQWKMDCSQMKRRARATEMCPEIQRHGTNERAKESCGTIAILSETGARGNVRAAPSTDQDAL